MKQKIRLTESQLNRVIKESIKSILKESDDKYDYKKAIYDDVLEYIKYNFDETEIIEGLENRNKWEQELYDTLFTEDSVTGNGSGSYWFNAYKAEKALAHNMQLYFDALKEFGGSTPELFSPEEADVTIRCYLLYSAIDEVLDELQDEIQG